MSHLVNGIAEAWFRYMASATVQATLLALFILGALWIGCRWSPALRHALMMLAGVRDFDVRAFRVRREQDHAEFCAYHLRFLIA